MLAVITGGSRGLGAALVRALLEGGHDVIAAARGPAPVRSDRLHWISCDLADLAVAGNWIERALAGRTPSDRVALILNAGMIEPLCPVRDLQPADTDRHLRLNLAGPMLDTAGFLRATGAWGSERRVMAISSGAARRGISHWAAYCAAKAGLDGFIRALVEEADHPGGPVRAVSIAPGLVDTAMQEAVRTRDTPTRQHYQAAFEAGSLLAPDEVAMLLLDYLQAPSFGDHTLDDIRDVAARVLQQ